MSVIAEMRPLLGTEPLPLEDTLAGLLSFCEQVGIILKSDRLEELLAELDGWLTDSDLTNEERVQLREFTRAIKKLVFKGARAAGKVHHAYQAAKTKVQNFKSGVKNAARAGYASGHHTGARPTGKRPGQKRPGHGGPKRRRTVKRPGSGRRK
jgi:hypothetical protein